MTEPKSRAVLCLTPNPALDRTLTVPDLQLGTVARAPSARVAAGGKGVNVARALAALGTEALCMGPIGGASGRILADLAAAENLDAAWTWCDVETRSCIILVDPAARQTTVINEAGPLLQPGDWNRVSAEVLARASEARAVCLSGSLPPGVAAD
ncbi:MAG TPA: PfkB family carbohydrate kinase, partial [Thermoanaerobaculia bacterium]|nr:PfkB family carbohydrate kinase [Thermoanaerobaculia bacterium]